MTQRLTEHQFTKKVSTLQVPRGWRPLRTRLRDPLGDLYGIVIASLVDDEAPEITVEVRLLTPGDETPEDFTFQASFSNGIFVFWRVVPQPDAQPPVPKDGGRR